MSTAPFHGRAFPAKRQLAVGFAGDGHNPEIDFGRIGCVDRKLRVAGLLALGERRIVEKRETHRALNLERTLAGEEH
jgi:hypothetical protein